MAAFTIIDHTELSGSASSWDVTSIPSSYDHLFVRWSARSDQSHAYVNDNIECKLNGDTGTNYSVTRLLASSNPPWSYRSTGSGMWNNWGQNPDAMVQANTFGIGSMWIPYYANTANYKQGLSNSALENNSATNDEWRMALAAGLWTSTAAVNQITFTTQNAANFIAYSTFTLYGVTGA
jgi:hypothetical protein